MKAAVLTHYDKKGTDLEIHEFQYLSRRMPLAKRILFQVAGWKYDKMAVTKN